MKTLLFLALAALAVVLVQRAFFSFAAQKIGAHAGSGLPIDIRRHLSGRLVSEGVVFGPDGSMATRFVAEMERQWDGGQGTLAAEVAGPGGVQVLPFDVTDAEATARAAAEAAPVDAVIYAAGRCEPMTAAAWDAGEAVAIAEVNFMGALRLLGHVVPGMVRRGAGHVVLVGSLAAHRGLPGAIGYGASKAALLSLAETMRADLRGTGVRVQIANPGLIRTRLTAKNAFAMPQLTEPEDAAARIVALMAGGRFRSDFPAPFAWAFTLGRCLPLGLFHRLLRRG